MHDIKVQLPVDAFHLRAAKSFTVKFGVVVLAKRFHIVSIWNPVGTVVMLLVVARNAFN